MFQDLRTGEAQSRLCFSPVISLDFTLRDSAYELGRPLDISSPHSIAFGGKNAFEKNGLFKHGPPSSPSALPNLLPRLPPPGLSRAVQPASLLGPEVALPFCWETAPLLSA